MTIAIPLNSAKTLLIIAVLLLVVHACLKTIKFTKTTKLLRRMAEKYPSQDVIKSETVILANARRYQNLINKAANYVGSNCLCRSLALSFLLMRKGVSCSLKFGQRFDSNGKIEAHAWLEYQQSVINDEVTVNSQYKSFDKPLNLS